MMWESPGLPDRRNNTESSTGRRNLSGNGQRPGWRGALPIQKREVRLVAELGPCLRRPTELRA